MDENSADILVSEDAVRRYKTLHTLQTISVTVICSFPHYMQNWSISPDSRSL